MRAAASERQVTASARGGDKYSVFSIVASERFAFLLRQMPIEPRIGGLHLVGSEELQGTLQTPGKRELCSAEQQLLSARAGLKAEKRE